MFGINKKGNSIQTLVKTIAAAATPEALSSDHIFCKYIDIQSLIGNTSAYLCIGDSNVDLATNQGIKLAKGNTYRIEGEYLDNIYVDVGTDGDKVGVTYEEVRTL